MIKIKDIISVNEKATLVKGVQLGWFNNLDKLEENNRLAVGYVFGNPNKRSNFNGSNEISSLSLFENIRNALNGNYDKNIFTVIANYGHGKSHFALVLANYFGLSSESSVVTQIADNIESISNLSTANHFRSFKQINKKPALVITLSGSDIQNLQQGFLKSLRHALNNHSSSQTYSIKATSVEAAKWVKKLSGDIRVQAEEYIAEHHRMDLDALIEALENFDTEKEQVAKELCQALIGVSGDFGSEVSLQEVIGQVIKDLCEGNDAPFSKMLILFDELGVYAEKWCNNRMAAGYLAPQQIIEACNNKPGKLCLVSFVQREISEIVRDYPLKDECMKWAKRLPEESQFKLTSNLEEVISKIVLPKDKNQWDQVIRDNAPHIQEEAEFSRTAFETYQGWNKNDFYQTVARDCYPLHPLTTGILCNLDFTQEARSVIEAVGSVIKNIEDEPTTSKDGLTWVNPIDLVNFFEKDFARQSTEYALYENAVRNIGHNEDKIYYDVLKALFLFYEGRIKRTKSISHIEFLSRLSGYSDSDTKKALQYLIKEHDVIRFNTANGEYNFTGIGTNSIEIIKRLRNETTGKQLEGSISNALIKFGLLEKILWQKNDAVGFKREFAIEGDEWRLKPAFLDASQLSIDNVKNLVKTTLEANSERGAVIYLIAEEAESLQRAKEESEKIIDKLKENFPYPFVIAIPNNPASQIKSEILVKNKLLEMPPADKKSYEQSFEEAVSRVDEDLEEQLISHLAQTDSVQFVVASNIRMKLGSMQNDLEEISSALFAEFYNFRAPAMSNSLKTTGNKANAATAEIAKQLIVGNLNFSSFDAEKKNIITSVLMDGRDKWGILDPYYKVQEPKNTKVREAWNLIVNNLKEDEPVTFSYLIGKLTRSPFGYDIYTLTLLLSAFIGKYRYELSFADNGRSIRLVNVETVLDTKSKKFIEWLSKGSVTLTLAGHSKREKAQEYLQSLKDVGTLVELTEILSEFENIIEALPPKDGLRLDIIKQRKTAEEFLSKKEKQQIGINKLIAESQKIEDIEQLLLYTKELDERIAKDEEGNIYIEPLQKINQRIEDLVYKQSRVSLGKIEAYYSVRDQLEKAKDVLHEANRPELEKLFADSLEKVNQDYHRLIAAKEEEPLLLRINSFRSSNTPLNDFVKNLEELNEITTDNLSERLKEVLTSKKEAISKQIEKLRNTHNGLNGRINEVNNISSAQRLREDIISNNWIFVDTPEANSLQETLEKIQDKVKLFEEQRRLEQKQLKDAEEAENKRKRIAAEKDRAKFITQEFASLSSTEEQYKCFLEIIKTLKSKGITSTQVAEIINELE